jgi:hypothetical protein
MSDSSEKWDAFDYLTVAGVALFLGGLGSALFCTLDVALSSCRRTRVHGDRGLRRLPKWRCFNQV